MVRPMTKNVSSTQARVGELFQPVLDQMGFELVDVEYLANHGRWVLRLYIDKEGGVTIDDCVRVSREIGDLIDVKEVVTNEYVLEVSSPGLNRPLKKERDYIRAIGKKIRVTMIAPVDGRRNFTGDLKSFQGGVLYLDVDRKRVPLPWHEVDKANLVYPSKQ